MLPTKFKIAGLVIFLLAMILRIVLLTTGVISPGESGMSNRLLTSCFMFLGMMIIALSKDKVEHTDNNRCRLSSVFMVLTFGFIDVFFMPLVDIFTGSNPKNLHPDRMLVVGAVMYVILYHWSKRRLNRVAPVN